MESDDLQEFAVEDRPKIRRLPGWLKIALLLVVLGIILNVGVALARLDGKFASRQAMAISKALGAWQAPVDYQFTGQGRIVGCTGKTWVVSGVPIRLGEHTQLIGDLRANDAVLLSGQILESGVWLADRIELADVQDSVFTYNGTLDAIEAGIWRVGGLDLVVDDATQLSGTMAVSDLVLVTFTPVADGSKKALTIEPFDQPWVEPTPLPTATPKPESSGSGEKNPAPPPTRPPEVKSSNTHGTFVVCHKPNKKGGHTLTVGGSALESHLKHGDKLGPCR